MANHDDDRIDLENPLGISGEAVTPDGNIHASNDEESVRRRRARALGQTEPETTNGMGALDPNADGASGVDMGYGGSGTDIKTTK